MYQQNYTFEHNVVCFSPSNLGDKFSPFIYFTVFSFSPFCHWLFANSGLQYTVSTKQSISNQQGRRGWHQVEDKLLEFHPSPFA